MNGPDYLSKREQQIMELVYQRERVTAVELTSLLPGRPSNSTVRTLLRILEDREYLVHEEEGGRYVYRAKRPRRSAAREAINSLIQTFFRGSVGEVVATLISEDGDKISDAELDRLEALIRTARKEGR